MGFLQIQPNSAEWHSIRQQFVGASEVAALFDLSPWTTRFELWHLKKGNISDNFSGNVRTRYGQKLEAAIAECVEEETGWGIAETVGYYTHDSIKGMGCTPDRIIISQNGMPGCLEIKNVDRLQFSKDWTDDEPPLHIILQLQHQLACTKMTWGVVAALVGGNDLKLYTFDRHEKTIAKLEAAVTEFWISIEKNQEPAPFSANDFDTVKRLFNEVKEEEIDLSGDNELPVLCAELSSLSGQSGSVEKRQKELKARILHKLGNASMARCNGFLIKAPEIVKHMKPKEAHVQKYRQLTVKEISA